MSKEKVIFRTEKNPYDRDREYYIAAFPEESANPGCIAILPFTFRLDGNTMRAVFEPLTEASYVYYYGTKLVHKNTDKARACLAAVEKYYETKFDVREKLTNRW